MDQWRAFGILWVNNYSQGSKITTWLVSEIELTFETGDLGLTCNTGPYRTNGRSCGWRRPSEVRIWCHMDALTRDRIKVDTVREDWRYNFHSVVSWDGKVNYSTGFPFFLFFFSFLLSRCLVFWSGLGDLFVSQSPKELYESHSGLCIHHLIVWSNLSILHNSQLITFHAQSSIVLYSFCSSLLYLLMMWLTISSVFPHYYYLLILEFFTPSLADGFPLEAEWQQVSSSFQDFHYYYYYYYYFTPY